MTEIYLITPIIVPSAITVEDGIIKETPPRFAPFIGKSFELLKQTLIQKRVKFTIEKVETND